jgi:hypothetical protein
MAVDAMPMRARAGTSAVVAGTTRRSAGEELRAIRPLLLKAAGSDGPIRGSVVFQNVPSPAGILVGDRTKREPKESV